MFSFLKAFLCLETTVYSDHPGVFLNQYCLNYLMIHHECAKERLASGATAEQFVKDISELHIEGSVDDGVDGTVHVTEPCDHTDQRRPDVTWLAQRLSHMNHEERSPAGQKHTWGGEDHVRSWCMSLHWWFFQLFHVYDWTDYRQQKSWLCFCIFITSLIVSPIFFTYCYLFIWLLYFYNFLFYTIILLYYTVCVSCAGNNDDNMIRLSLPLKQLYVLYLKGLLLESNCHANNPRAAGVTSNHRKFLYIAERDILVVFSSPDCCH